LIPGQTGDVIRAVQHRHDFVVVANRLPLDRTDTVDGVQWQPSPGGLVSAVEPIMRRANGVWIGWTGAADEAPEPFEADDMTLIAVGLSQREIAEYYEGFCNATIWPLYHDVIVAPEFHRRWWDAYVSVNRRFAEAAAAAAARDATVWVHDYQLQLVPGILRELRPDLRIGFFNHIPFPGYEIFAQLPRRRQIIEGLLGAGLLGFQRRSDTTNFLRACRRAAGLTTRGNDVLVGGPGGGRTVHIDAFPISIDVEAMDELATRDDVQARAKEIRAAVGDPQTVLLGVDRLDYTKGILHRLQAFEELLAEGSVEPDQVRMVVVATPSRERVEQYQRLREEVEATVGRINGEYAIVGHPPVHYLHHSYPKDEMAALFLSADILLVTSLRDGMNLVAKEYVAAHRDERGVLVLSEFAGAADELTSALLINPHDVEGLKRAILAAIQMPPAEVRRRMRALRRRVRENDVTAWADRFLSRLRAASSP
jgi:alpha,alpha-trehalose-phosphate synthase [UDP-forming]